MGDSQKRVKLSCPVGSTMADDEEAEPCTSAPTWFPCPGCDKIVTHLVQRGHSDVEAGHYFYSQKHCCLVCENNPADGHCEDVWGCAAVPGEAFRELRLPGIAAPAHYLLHDPGSTSPLPALLFLHGSITYLYPESLWWDLKKLIDHNSVVREHFVVVAPFCAVGEPIARVSEFTKADRYRNDVPYVDSFDDELTWATFVAALEALGPHRVDMSRLHVVGYSMGGQAAWGIAIRHGSSLASVAPFAGRCAWPQDAWNREDEYLDQVRKLPIWCYHGEADTGTYSFRDLWWLADQRGLPVTATQRTEKTETGLELLVHEWSGQLQLNLVRNGKVHCVWDPVFQNEQSFGLFTRMLGVRCEDLSFAFTKNGGAVCTLHWRV